jgi:hypothetical protein
MMFCYTSIVPTQESTTLIYRKVSLSPMQSIQVQAGCGILKVLGIPLNSEDLFGNNNCKYTSTSIIFYTECALSQYHRPAFFSLGLVFD